MNEDSKKHHKLLIVLSLLVVGMFAFGFALVPIYNSLCQALNINGKTNATAIAYDASKAKVDLERMLTVEFVATKAGECAVGILSQDA